MQMKNVKEGLRAMHNNRCKCLAAAEEAVRGREYTATVSKWGGEEGEAEGRDEWEAKGRECGR